MKVKNDMIFQLKALLNEGFNYLFPHYDIANNLVETYERIKELGNKEEKDS